jgi:hypothetical protein
VFPSDLRYTHETAIKIGKWQEAQKAAQNGKDSYQQISEGDYRPGDFMVEHREAQYNDSHRFLNDVKDYLKSKNVKRFEVGDKTAKRRLYERFRHRGISGVIEAMAEHRPFKDGVDTRIDRSERSKQMQREWLEAFDRGITLGDISLV